jgi:hypothetical protein
VSVFREGVRQRAPGLHFLVDAVEDALEGGVRDALAQDVERLDQRHARLEERGELLVEDEKLLSIDPAPRPGRREKAGNPAPWLQREDVQPFSSS